MNILAAFLFYYLTGWWTYLMADTYMPDWTTNSGPPPAEAWGVFWPCTVLIFLVMFAGTGFLYIFNEVDKFSVHLSQPFKTLHNWAKTPDKFPAVRNYVKMLRATIKDRKIDPDKMLTK